jgi:hypothetical protein
MAHDLFLARRPQSWENDGHEIEEHRPVNIHITPSLMLTTERAESHDGIPVLVNREDDVAAYGPRETIHIDHQFQPAAYLVARFGKALTGDERAAAAIYLRQWPEGPQLLAERR